MTPLQSIVDRVLSRLRMPVLVRVDRSYIRKASGGYCLDGMVLRPGSMEETGEILKEVPISPIWAGKRGQGVYCPPEDGQVVVVNWISGNSAWPFVAGIWSDGITPADGRNGRFVITDGQGGSFALNGSGLFAFGNQSESLKALLEGLCGELKKIKVVDPISGVLPLSSDNVITITVLEGRIAALLEAG